MQISSPYSGILAVSVEQVHFYTPSDLIFSSLHKSYPPTYLISLFPVMYLTEKGRRKGDYSNFCLWNLRASLLQLIMWHTLCQRAVSPHLSSSSVSCPFSYTIFPLHQFLLLWIISARTQTQCNILGFKYIGKCFLHTIFITIYDVVICFLH